MEKGEEALLQSWMRDVSEHDADEAYGMRAGIVLNAMKCFPDASSCGTVDPISVHMLVRSRITEPEPIGLVGLQRELPPPSALPAISSVDLRPSVTSGRSTLEITFVASGPRTISDAFPGE